MISHKEKTVKTDSLDTLLTHRLKNWSGRAAPPASGKRRLLAAVKGWDSLEEAQQTNFFRRYLPVWLQTYLLDSNRFRGAGDYSQTLYANRSEQISYSLMIYLYGVRITVS